MSNAKTVKLVNKAIADAKALLGPGWYHVSPAIRRGLVMEGVVAVLYGQDESIDPARVVALMRDLVEEVNTRGLVLE